MHPNQRQKEIIDLYEKMINFLGALDTEKSYLGDNKLGTYYGQISVAVTTFTIGLSSFAIYDLCVRGKNANDLYKGSEKGVLGGLLLGQLCLIEDYNQYSKAIIGSLLFNFSIQSRGVFESTIREYMDEELKTKIEKKYDRRIKKIKKILNFTEELSEDQKSRLIKELKDYPILGMVKAIFSEMKETKFYNDHIDNIKGWVELRSRQHNSGVNLDGLFEHCDLDSLVTKVIGYIKSGNEMIKKIDKKYDNDSNFRKIITLQSSPQSP